MLDRIRASIPALPPAEQRVARLLLADPRSFATLPVVELAERAHVSKPTVVRFCRSIGYDGLAFIDALETEDIVRVDDVDPPCAAHVVYPDDAGALPTLGPLRCMPWEAAP